MSIRKHVVVLFLLTAFGVALFPGCEDDPPQGIYDEKYVNSVGVPVVTSVVPDGAPYILGGVTGILINGSGFVTDTSVLNVYFNSTKIPVTSATATQLKVLAPNMILDSIKVRVYITGSDKFSDLKYINIRSAFEYVKEIDTSKVTPAAITFNKLGELFASVVTKSGTSDGIYKVNTAGATVSFAGRGTEPFFSGLKMKGDSIYAARRVNRIVSRNSNSAATPPNPMNIFSAALPTTVEDFDYDVNRVMWTGGNTMNGGIIRYDSLKVAKLFPFSGIIRSVRVYNGALYVSNEASDSTNAVYKIPIVASDSSLGTAEKYFDLSATVNNKNNKVFGITFDNTGNLYVGTDAAAGIYVVAPDKSVQPLYNGVIGPNCKYLAWGNGAFLYVVREKATSTSAPTGIFKIDMLGKLSAPYYGQ